MEDLALEHNHGPKNLAYDLSRYLISCYDNFMSKT